MDEYKTIKNQLQIKKNKNLGIKYPFLYLKKNKKLIESNTFKKILSKYYGRELFLEDIENLLYDINYQLEYLYIFFEKLIPRVLNLPLIVLKPDELKISTPKIYIPLDHWLISFNDTKKLELLESEEYKEIIAQYHKLKMLSLADTKDLLDRLIRFRNKYTRELQLGYIPNSRGHFGDDIFNIQQRYNQLQIEQISEAKLYYSHKIKTSEKEIVNGYSLYRTDEDIIDYDDFVYYKNIWKKTLNFDNEIINIFINYTKLPLEIINIIIQYGIPLSNNIKEMSEWLDEYCCTDWSKMDENGECYEGFWKFPENSYENKNAWDLTKEKNVNCLLELPYPYEIIKDTIKIGCNNRQESVKYSNFICEWIRRKLIVIKILKR